MTGKEAVDQFMKTNCGSVDKTSCTPGLGLIVTRMNDYTVQIESVVLPTDFKFTAAECTKLGGTPTPDGSCCVSAGTKLITGDVALLDMTAKVPKAGTVQYTYGVPCSGDSGTGLLILIGAAVGLYFLNSLL